MAECYIGLMSGTSLDGVDGLLLDMAAPRQTAVKAFASVDFSPELRAEFLALNHSGGSNELHRAALAGNALALAYAEVVGKLLAQAGLEAADVAAIGAHGQTVRHQPQLHDGMGYTLQINQGALLAERTGITVVADFRSRDVAAGGQGAPLAPFFHQAWFEGAGARGLAVLNIGGISNLSVLRAEQPVLGFDCGPGNALMDAWVQQHKGQAFDADGAWAASGQVDADLLARLLSEPYFSQSAPKSTGRDLFHLDWLQGHLAASGQAVAAVDVQATLLELTARSVAHDVLRHAMPLPPQLLVCGGGAYNGALMRRLQALLPELAVRSSAEYGLAPNQVEAAAFAWLAAMAVRGQRLDLSPVTGAQGARILGAIYPA